jgi:pimeloyl-ACP methyl ester carboxylesterase
MSHDRGNHATSADGTRIAFWCFGRGDPILFVHGLSGSHVNWQPIAELLSSGFTGCTVDRRGRGESGDGVPYGFEREAEDVTAVTETLGRVVVLAHSISGPFALEAAMTSDAVRAVILYEAWASPLSEIPREDLEEIERLVSLGRYEEAFNYGDSPEDKERSPKLPDYAERVATAPTFGREIRGWERYWQDHPVDDERWRALDKPVLLLVGELNRDGMEPPAQRFAERLPQATIRVLERQGHMAYREAPDLVVEVVRSWLESLDATGDR